VEKREPHVARGAACGTAYVPSAPALMLRVRRHMAGSKMRCRGGCVVGGGRGLPGERRRRQQAAIVLRGDMPVFARLRLPLCLVPATMPLRGASMLRRSTVDGGEVRRLGFAAAADAL